MVCDSQVFRIYNPTACMLGTADRQGYCLIRCRLFGSHLVCHFVEFMVQWQGIAVSQRSITASNWWQFVLCYFKGSQLAVMTDMCLAVVCILVSAECCR